MNFLLVAATIFEIRPLIEKLPLLGKQGEHLSRYQYKSGTIDVLISGVGMIPIAYFLGRQLALQHYDLAINAGIAGTFNRSFPLGTVVNVIEDCVPEMGAEDGDHFLSIFELGLLDPDAHPYSHGKLVNDFSRITSLHNLEAIRRLPTATGITSNTIRGNAASIQKIQKMASADLESMEGAAFFYACLSAEVPCLQIRAISNMVEERDKSRWKLNLALKNLNKVLWESMTQHNHA